MGLCLCLNLFVNNTEKLHIVKKTSYFVKMKENNLEPSNKRSLFVTLTNSLLQKFLSVNCKDLGPLTIVWLPRLCSQLFWFLIFSYPAFISSKHFCLFRLLSAHSSSLLWHHSNALFPVRAQNLCFWKSSGGGYWLLAYFWHCIP